MPRVSLLPLVSSLGSLARRVGRLLLGLFAVGASMVLLTWLILQWGILPRIDRWQPEIERWASQAVGAPVHIADIEVTGGLWNPVLTLQNVRLTDREGREALTVNSVRALLVPRSLLPTSLTQWEPRFEQLLVEGLRLEVRRDAQGQLWVAGLPLGGAKDEHGRGADWLFSQREVALRQGSLVWTDETRPAPPLALTQVDLVLRNSATRHRLRLDATPPPAWGERFSVQADLRQSLLTLAGLEHRGDWRRWRGQVYASLPLVDVHALHQHVDLPVDLHEGRAALQAWLQLASGKVVGGSANVALRDVQAQLGDGLEPLALASLSARIEAQAQHTGPFGGVEPGRLDIRQLTFDTGDGVRWPRSDMSFSLQRAADGQVQGGSVEATQLELQVLADLAGRVPLAGPMRQFIEQAAPQGRLDNFQLRWQGRMASPASWWTAGQAHGLQLAGATPPAEPDTHTRPGRPGVHNADVDFEFTERGGTALLKVNDGALDLPGVFDEPRVPLTQFAGELRWRVDQSSGKTARPAVSVELRNASLANADTAGTLDVQWRTGAADGAYLPGVLDLHVRLTRANAARVHRYLPFALPEGTRHYVRDALRSGHATRVTARVRGDLHEFPFSRAGSGDFNVRALVQDAEFAYVPGSEHPWPPFTQAQAELVFDRQSLQVHNGQARVGSLGSGSFALSQVEGGIDDFLHQPTLRLQGRGQGPMSDALAYVRSSPLSRLLGHALDSTTASGNTELSLGLTIPLAQVEHTEVRGSVVLAGNTVQMRPDVPPLAEARGRVDFSHDGFNVVGGSAKALGGNLTFEGGQPRDGPIRFTAQGSASAEGLRRAVEWPGVPELATQLSGQAAYRLQLGFQPGGHTELLLTSNLVGLASRLPAPLAKAETDNWPLRISVAPQGMPSAAPGTARELVRAELAAPGGSAAAAPLLDVQYLREHGTDGQTRVLRGALAVGTAATLPETQEPTGTVTAQVVLPTLSIDAWTDWNDRRGLEAGSGNSGGGGGGGARAVPGKSDRDPSASGYAPSRILLRTQRLTAQGQHLDQVTATLVREPGFEGPRAVTDWRADISADQLAGRIEVRDGGGSGPGRIDNSRVKARLTRLSWSKEAAGGNATSAAASNTPASSAIDRLPAIDVAIDALEWQGKALGRLELVAANRGDGSREAPREWRISKLALTLPEAQLTASGNWAAGQNGTPGGARRTALAFELDIQDSGQLLDRMGFAGTVRGGHGQLKGQLGWTGAPTAVHWPSLNGTLRLDLDKGRFLHADPGVARLLGVLSLQSLPRRLLLDFSDVFKEGFSFDRMDGDASIQQGIATTRNLRIRGVQAAVLTEGSADLAKETQDLHVWVVPDINAGAASLAYAAINPVIGLGTLLGQLFLRKQLAEATTRQFRVTGRWDAPQVDPVSHEQGRPSPQIAEPAASSSPRPTVSP